MLENYETKNIFKRGKHIINNYEWTTTIKKKSVSNMFDIYVTLVRVKKAFYYNTTISKSMMNVCSKGESWLVIPPKG